MNFKTYEDLTKTMVKNLYKIPRDIDLIVGIPRSGTMAGNILALYLNLPFTDLGAFLLKSPLKTGTTRKCQHWIHSIDEAQHVLVVDDSISSGEAVRNAKKQIEQAGFSCQITYLAIYALTVSKNMVDLFFEICEQPRMFEWNYMHHWGLEFCCMDIDGVLCEDPTPFQNDDGHRYADFIENASPRFLPTQKVGWLVTSRLEKYRSGTVEWLRKYGIEYGELIMMDGVSAKERALTGSHASFKSEVYSQTCANLFFESNYEQALEICHLSGRPVFCVENRTMITNNNLLSKMRTYQSDTKIVIKHAVKKLLKKIR